MPKKLKGTLWEFSTILSQNFETIEGSLFGKKIPKNLAVPKKTERGPFGLVRYCMLQGKPFWLFLGQTGTFWSLPKNVKNFWGRTILVISGVSKKNLTQRRNRASQTLAKKVANF